jgi:methylmalonyl-CoA carboxyltransferase large subunit
MGDPDAAAAEMAELQATIRSLTARVDALEARVRAFHPDDAIPDDVLVAISAACAAYLGKRATVKQVRLRRQGSWVAQGRAGIHRSHAVY